LKRANLHDVVPCPQYIARITARLSRRFAIPHPGDNFRWFGIWKGKMPSAAQCAVVIFGASGDLSQLKLVPAIYELLREGSAVRQIPLVGYARSSTKKDGTPLNDQTYRGDCYEAIKKNARHKPIDEACGRRWSRTFSTSPALMTGPTTTPAGLACWPGWTKPTTPAATGCFTSPRRPMRLRGSSRASASAQRPGPDRPTGWQRLIIEKPFGRDLASAKHLNAVLHKYWEEKNIFRIDHYLGKEACRT
jgi:glucose-6-phosphate 1-dehydrogenase